MNIYCPELSNFKKQEYVRKNKVMIKVISWNTTLVEINADQLETYFYQGYLE